MPINLRMLAVAVTAVALMNNAAARELVKSCVQSLDSDAAEVVGRFDANLAAAGGASEERLRTRLVLASAGQADQGIQWVLVKAMNRCRLTLNDAEFQRVLTSYKYIGERAQAELKRILNTSGWPGISKFGKEIDQAAFLIVQHADSNPDFQREVLARLEKLAAQGETARENFALLFDRVATADGKPQRYGSQGKCSGKRFEILPTELGDLDVRRRSMGLGPIEDYRRRVSAMTCAQ